MLQKLELLLLKISKSYKKIKSEIIIKRIKTAPILIKIACGIITIVFTLQYLILQKIHKHNISIFYATVMHKI